MSKPFQYDNDTQDKLDAIDAHNMCLEGKIEDAYCELKERIRELEADNAKLLGVIGSMKDIVVMRDNMIGDFISDLQKAMNDQIRGVMDKTLTDVIRVTQEKLDA